MNRHWSVWMPTPGNIIFTGIVITVLFWIQHANASMLNPPTSPARLIPYQGRLSDSKGSLRNGTYKITFALYADQIDGTAIWNEQYNSINVNEGLFNVMLGSITPIPPNIIDNQQLYLGVTVGEDSEMAPRVQLGAVPFAFQALTVPDSSITTAKLADSSVKSRNLSLTYKQIDIPFATTTNNDWIDIPNSTFTLTTSIPSVLEVTADLLLFIDNSNTAAFYALNVNGNRWTERYYQPNGGLNSAVAHYIHTVDPGIVTVKLQWKRAFGAGNVTLNNVGGVSYLSAKLWSQ